jgi:hypothetical protein
VRNKANSRLRREGRGYRDVGRRRMRKTKPIRRQVVEGKEVMVNCTNKPNLRITGPAGWGRAWYARYPLLRHAIGEKRQMPGVRGQRPGGLWPCPWLWYKHAVGNPCPCHFPCTFSDRHTHIFWRSDGSDPGGTRAPSRVGGPAPRAGTPRPQRS